MITRTFFTLAFFVSAAVFAQTKHTKLGLNNKFKQHQATKTIAHRLPNQGSALESRALNYFPQKAIVYYWDNAGAGSWAYSGNKITHYNINADVVYNLSTDTVTATPQNTDTSTYDLNRNQLSNLSQNWQSGSWVNSYRTTSTYDSQNNQTLYKSENWQSNAWVISYGNKTSYQYDGNNNITESIMEDWNTSSLVWENSYKYNTTYANNILTEQLGYEWQNNAWVSTSKLTNIVWHNYTNGEVQSYTEQHLVNNNWTNFANYSFTYTGNNYVSITDTIISGNWVNSSKVTYTEDVNGGYVYLNEIYQNSTWVNESQYSRYYDVNGNYTGSKDEVWGGTNWTTNYQDNNILTYSGNIITERIKQYWDNTNQLPVNYSKEVYSNFTQLEDATGIVTNISSNNELLVYPNPSNDFITIENKNGKLISPYVIINCLGQQILTGKLTNEKTMIDISALQEGFYLLQVGEEEKQTFKLVKK